MMQFMQLQCCYFSKLKFTSTELKPSKIGLKKEWAHMVDVETMMSDFNDLVPEMAKSVSEIYNLIVALFFFIFKKIPFPFKYESFLLFSLTVAYFFNSIHLS